MQNLKKGTNELIYTPDIELQTQKTILWLPAGNRGEDKLEDWNWHIHTTTYRTDN